LKNTWLPSEVIKCGSSAYKTMQKLSGTLSKRGPTASWEKGGVKATASLLP